MFNTFKISFLLGNSLNTLLGLSTKASSISEKKKTKMNYYFIKSIDGLNEENQPDSCQIVIVKQNKKKHAIGNPTSF